MWNFHCQGGATQLAHLLWKNAFKKPIRNLQSESDKSSESNSMLWPCVVTCVLEVQGKIPQTEEVTPFFLEEVGASRIKATRRLECIPQLVATSCPKYRWHRLQINTVLISTDSCSTYVHGLSFFSVFLLVLWGELVL